MGEVGDKFAIEIRKSEKRAYTLDGGRGFPFLNGREFDGVHLNLSLANDHAKEFDVWVHLESLRDNPCSWRQSRTCQVRSWWSVRSPWV